VAVGKWESRVLCGVSKLAGKVGSMTFPASVFSTAPRAGIFLNFKISSCAVYRPKQWESVGEAQGLIQVLMHHHLAACQGRSPAHALDLQAQILEAHRVVTVHAGLNWSEKMRSRSRLRHGTKALPRCAGAI